jgi:hypothetical protein
MRLGGGSASQNSRRSGSGRAGTSTGIDGTSLDNCNGTRGKSIRSEAREVLSLEILSIRKQQVPGVCIYCTLARCLLSYITAPRNGNVSANSAMIGDLDLKSRGRGKPTRMCSGLGDWLRHHLRTGHHLALLSTKLPHRPQSRTLRSVSQHSLQTKINHQDALITTSTKT